MYNQNPYPQIPQYNNNPYQTNPITLNSNPYYTQQQPFHTIQSKLQKEPTPLDKFNQIPINTLDQPITTTLCRQFQGIFHKFSYVLIPRSVNNNTNKLKNWDLWAPLFMALVFGIFIKTGTQVIFIILAIFVGSFIVTFNIRVLGGRISFLQSISVLGYCIFPIFAAAMLFQLMKFFQYQNPSKIFRFIILTVACIWSILSARTFISINVSEDRKFVAMFPLIIFYVFLTILLGFM